ncbi:ACP S-malonyltransferase [Aliidiomarina halalkaliphila]|uniref:[acyl-carrier-protein] S-malonyltransferase n=1 Tax=Aliidiomarina halalkaliphila TaxID=2593535 RepID=A0A552X1K0_9GAMM|nr:ACP S-malonyltransferase [Aliidiomarina halalkaliphila]TRW48855.1 ACP S-malonyltransferase [Aliidiomarina halalkaliphila]
MTTAAKKQRALVICPGRGTYNRPELGYLGRYHGQRSDLFEQFDALRGTDQPTVTALDEAATFSAKLHLHATNAAPLIYSCAYADFQAINRDRFDIVGVTGNSMGWYIALACAGALNATRGFELVSDMAAMTNSADLGGQLLYPNVGDDWRFDPELDARIQPLLSATGENKRLYTSIRFGGYQVLAGTSAAIQHGAVTLPPTQERYPLILPGHSAFHTPLMKAASEQALQRFSPEFFAAPEVPMIDGRGHIWQPLGTDNRALREYTLVHQVCETYDFSTAVVTAAKEFAPDVIILTGPGSTMGGAVAQALIAEQWQQITNKDDFVQRQKKSPLLLAMGLDEQRNMVTR